MTLDRPGWRLTRDCEPSHGSIVVVAGNKDPGSENTLRSGASPPVSHTPRQSQPAVILTPDQRVRVFISSTLEELAAERAAAGRAIARLHLVPVPFESGARPHPPRSVYRAYLAQSQIFVGIYWQRYGWVAPGMGISGLEDEYRLAAGKPMLLYLKRPAPGLEPRLAAMIDGIRAAGAVCYRTFATPRELERLLANDLAVLLSERFADGGTPTGEELPAGTVTFLLTDIEGSTRLWESVPDSMELALGRHNQVLGEVIEDHGGMVVSSRGEGDSLFAVFPGAVAAVEAAGVCQLRLAAEAWPAGAALRVRMGLHTGQARAPGSGRVDHTPINRCARVRGAAHGGQVLATQATRDLAGGQLGDGFGLRRLGEFRLRDLAEPEVIYQLTHADLPADFPPIVMAAERTGNLPLQASTFIGRVREKSEVKALTASSRLVTLTGPGGCGKTRLALEVAAQMRDECGDGAWLVELAAVSDRGMVASAICKALGVDGQPGRPSLEALLDAIAPQDMLIVLDNCEHLTGGCAKVASAIVRHCPKVRLMATSREPLGITAETIYRVPPLSLPGLGEDDAAAAESSDAVALFADRASKQGVLVVDEQTAPLVVSICRQLDGLPLAIVLAAARLRSLSLRGLAARLDQRFRLLTGGSRTSPARQQTLRATIEWSYSLLYEVEQSLLRRLSVFPDSFDLDAAEAACGFGEIDAFDVTDLLGSLVDKSLVAAEPAADTLRYRLLETIRQFAAERLAKADGDEASTAKPAYCAHYLSVAETAAPHLTGPEQGEWLARLDLEQANLRRAADYAARNHDGTAQVLRLGVALKRYWATHSRAAVEGLALLMPALDRPESRADPPLLAAALATAADLAIKFQDIAIARRLAQQAVTLARQLDDDRLLIESLSTLSRVDYQAGDSGPGLPSGQEAVTLARRLGDDVLLGESLTTYLLWEDAAGFPDAKSLFAEAIACTTRSGDHLYAGHVNNIATIHALRTGDIPAARTRVEEAARAMRAIGYESSTVLTNLGSVLLRDDDPDGARISFESALRASRHNGLRGRAAYAILGLACLAANAGDSRRAAVLHGIAEAFLDSTGQPWEALEAGYREDSLANLRGHLGLEQFDRAFAQGKALSFDAAIDVAFGKAQSDPLGLGASVGMAWRT
jgi:predicted ATPase/class 3 adenylate cyclase